MFEGLFCMRGDRLRDLRESWGLSQLELAQELETGDNQIWRYENGTAEPRMSILLRIARFFNVSADYLIGNSDSPNPVPANLGLSEQEEAIITALRRGQKLKAIEIIVSEKPVK
jgi:transcriptional regulator with XRE-family HTH domain